VVGFVNMVTILLVTEKAANALISSVFPQEGLCLVGWIVLIGWVDGRLRLKCDGTRAETRFRLSAKRTSPFKSSVGVSSVDYCQPRCAHQR
jgi:hypothetical protein